jgi:hypothetical protein
MNIQGFDLELDFESDEKVPDIKYGFYEILNHLRKHPELCAYNTTWEEKIYVDSFLKVLDERVIPVNFTLNIMDCISQNWMLKEIPAVQEERFNEFLDEDMRDYVAK